MAATLVGIFDDYAHAQKAVQALSKAGIKQGDVSIARNEPAGKGYTTYGGAKANDYNTGESIGDSIAGFFGSLFGASDDPAVKQDSDLYAESVRRGGTAVTVKVEDDMIEKAADVLNDSGAIDVDRRHAQLRKAGYKGHDPKAPPYNHEQTKTEMKTFAEQGEMTLPVIEEQLNVGKRVVQRGGVRVHTHITERPVEEKVTLREEHVKVERHPVDRAVSDADMKNLKDGEINITTTAEEAVVGKQAHVVEEVTIGKNVTEREETIRDTVKRTDVEVEQTKADTDRAKTQKKG